MRYRSDNGRLVPVTGPPGGHDPARYAAATVRRQVSEARLLVLGSRWDRVEQPPAVSASGQRAAPEAGRHPTKSPIKRVFTGRASEDVDLEADTAVYHRAGAGAPPRPAREHIGRWVAATFALCSALLALVSLIR